MALSVCGLSCAEKRSLIIRLFFDFDSITNIKGKRFISALSNGGILFPLSLQELDVEMPT